MAKKKLEDFGPIPSRGELSKCAFRVFKLLSPRQKRQLIPLLLGVICVSFAETGAVGSIALFVTTVSDPQSLMNSGYFATVDSYFSLDQFRDPKTLILTIGMLSLGAVFFKNIIRVIFQYVSMRFSAGVDAHFGRRVLSGLLNMPYVWHIRNNSSDLIQIVYWRSFCGSVFVQACIALLSDTVLMLFMLATLVVMSPQISLLAILTVGLSSTAIYFFMGMFHNKVAESVRDLSVSMARQIMFALQGVKDVIVSGRKGSIIHNYNSEVGQLSRMLAAQRLLTDSPALILESVGYAMLIFAIGLMLFVFESSKAMTTGMVALLAVVAWRLLPAVSRVLSSLASIRNALPYVYRVVECIDKSTPEVQDTLCDKRDLTYSESIRFTDVRYRYDPDGADVLRGVNLSIERGTAFGVVGESGAGKSTLVDILTGLLEPFSGSVTVDSVPLDKSTIDSWRGMLGYVPQDPYIVDGTLAENIAFGCNQCDIDEDRVLECCELASINFLADLENGIHSMIGERGVSLSGGQCQRVAIARALYHNPRVLIFDEATSALDGATEKGIQNTIYGLKGELTLIIVAHRLSTVEECDCMVWIQSGEVVKQGLPSDILPELKTVSSGSK